MGVYVKLWQMAKFWPSLVLKQSVKAHGPLVNIMGPYGSENFKMLLFLQLQFFFNQTFSLRQYMYNFLNFDQWPSFMPKYGNFENQPVSRKPLPIE